MGFRTIKLPFSISINPYPNNNILNGCFYLKITFTVIQKIDC